MIAMVCYGLLYLSLMLQYGGWWLVALINDVKGEKWRGVWLKKQISAFENDLSACCDRLKAQENEIFVLRSEKATLENEMNAQHDACVQKRKEWACSQVKGDERGKCFVSK